MPKPKADTRPVGFRLTTGALELLNQLAPSENKRGQYLSSLILRAALEAGLVANSDTQPSATDSEVSALQQEVNRLANQLQTVKDRLQTLQGEPTQLGEEAQFDFDWQLLHEPIKQLTLQESVGRPRGFIATREGEWWAMIDRPRLLIRGPFVTREIAEQQAGSMVTTARQEQNRLKTENNRAEQAEQSGV